MGNNSAKIENLPNDLAREILLNSSPSQIDRFCSINKRYEICNDEGFWELKYIRDYGNYRKRVDSWKDLYMAKFNPEHITTKKKNSRTERENFMREPGGVVVIGGGPRCLEDRITEKQMLEAKQRRLERENIDRQLYRLRNEPLFRGSSSTSESSSTSKWSGAGDVTYGGMGVK